MSKKNNTQKIKDTSPKVYQSEKLNWELNIKELEWTEKQKVFIETALHKNTHYIICEAPSGVGKTILSVYIGLRLLQQRKISKIYFVRLPLESSSKGLGFLKGDLNEKFDPYIQPMLDNLNQLLPSSEVNKLIKDGFIEAIPIGFLKGRTLNCSLIIADECEDLLPVEFSLVMTRLGKFSKMIFIGDSNQSNTRNNGFKMVYETFDSTECMEKGIFCLKFDEADIMRNPILSYIINKFKYLNSKI